MSRPHYYNENDPYAAQWLRNLVAAGLIAPGDVDERSIRDVKANDLRDYTQCHFFAGVGGWSIALRLAGWSDDRPVWTGSCPCQPFSAAGAGKAADDERHLWPAWFSLIAELRPPVVLGEQVEAAIGWGWLDAVFADLEGEGYACASAVLPACGIGAPHIRQRCWFVADAGSAGSGRHTEAVSGAQAQGSGERLGAWRVADEPFVDGATGLVGDADRAGSQGRGLDRNGPGQRTSGPTGLAGGMVDATREQAGLSGCSRQSRSAFWACAEFIPCTDGKARPVESGSFPLAHGVRRRTSKLRAYGNAIVPQVAAEFIAAFTEAAA